MQRTTTSVLSASVLVAASVAAVALPASAATPGCRTTIDGGIVGKEVIASSFDVLAEAAPRTQRIYIDQVTVNYFGQTRYRIAAPIALVHVRAVEPRTFMGGTGYFVAPSDLAIDSRFEECVARVS